MNVVAIFRHALECRGLQKVPAMPRKANRKGGDGPSRSYRAGGPLDLCLAITIFIRSVDT
jgi:hypothetical protein